MIKPDWRAPVGVHAFVTTRAMGDMASVAARERLPVRPVWPRQVHGATVIDMDAAAGTATGDAAVARQPGVACAVQVADCMPVLFCDSEASVVGVAHAGWRGLAAGVLEAVVEKMNARSLVAWMGPAIGPRVYEVGEDVRAAFPGHDHAFVPNRPGHWLLDLYAVARAKLQASGVREVHGGGFCTFSEPERFYSYRREGSTGRMAALIWLAAE